MNISERVFDLGFFFIKENIINFLTEEQVKRYDYDYFISQGYATTVAWGHSHGADIIALQGNERFIIEAKGCGSRNAMRVNYFLAILGETLQRMDDADRKYYIALPKIQQYENLWRKLPTLARQRTAIEMILVDGTGKLEFFN